MSTDDELAALAAALADALQSRGWAMATAESCTGGWIAKCLTDQAGSSAWFERGWVTYSNAAKTADLNVSPVLINGHGAVSEPVVRKMADGARALSGAQIAVAVSGVAGPSGGAPGKPVGTVWLAWSTPDQCDATRAQFSGDRDSVRRSAVAAALRGCLARVSPDSLTIRST